MNRQISNSAYQELLEAFNIFDRDGSSSLSKKEFNQLVRALGIEIENNYNIDKLFEQIDDDGNEQISFEEFLKLMGYDTLQIDVNDIHETFKFFDTDNNGYITHEELHLAIFRLTRKRYRRHKISRMIRSVDEDGNGKIDIEEFSQLLKKL